MSLKWLVYVAASVCACLTGYAAFFHADAKWTMFALTVLFVALANIGRLTEFSASLTGIKLTLDKAGVAVDKLQRLVSHNAAAQLAMMQRGSRWDGWTEEHQQEFYRETVQLMRDHGVPEHEMQAILGRVWHPYVHIDYCESITGGLSNRNMSKDEWAEWQRMSEGLKRPTADELERFLARIIVIDGLRREVLDDYRYYRKHGLSANPDAFRRRSELHRSQPQFIRALPQE